LLGFGQRQSADSIDLLGNHHLARLQISDHPQQFGPVRAGTRRLLTVDASDVVAGSSRAVLNIDLTGEVLFVGADAEVEAGDFHGRWLRRVYATCPSWTT
jgi:hypothetical protein